MKNNAAKYLVQYRVHCNKLPNKFKAFIFITVGWYFILELQWNSQHKQLFFSQYSISRPLRYSLSSPLFSSPLCTPGQQLTLLGSLLSHNHCFRLSALQPFSYSSVITDLKLDSQVPQTSLYIPLSFPQAACEVLIKSLREKKKFEERISSPQVRKLATYYLQTSPGSKTPVKSTVQVSGSQSVVGKPEVSAWMGTC